MNLGSGIHTDADGYIAGQAPWVAKHTTSRKPKTYAEDRRCTCGARLSIYNDTNACASCSGQRWAEH
jgi:hypothetical protein